MLLSVNEDETLPRGGEPRRKWKLLLTVEPVNEGLRYGLLLPEVESEFCMYVPFLWEVRDSVC